MTSRRKLTASFAAALAVAGIGFTAGAPAHAAGPPPRTLTVGNCSDGVSFPAIQPAVDAAHPGDTVRICPGSYAEGSGQPGSNAVTIAESLTLAGAGQVTIKPRNNGGRIAEDSPGIRDGKGDIIAVTGTSGSPNFDPSTLGGGGTIPPATAVTTFAPAGDCGGPAGFGNCYGYEVNANAGLPGRPAVIDQPFGAGRAIMLGFDP